MALSHWFGCHKSFMWLLSCLSQAFEVENLYLAIGQPHDATSLQVLEHAVGGLSGDGQHRGQLLLRQVNDAPGPWVSP